MRSFLDRPEVDDGDLQIARKDVGRELDRLGVAVDYGLVVLTPAAYPKQFAADAASIKIGGMLIWWRRKAWR